MVGDQQAKGTDRVILENNPNLDAKAADGKGIDHAEEVYGPTVGAIVAACSA